MLTEEVIKSLKKGDKVLAEASVENVFTDGDIQVRVKTRKLDNTIGESLATLHSSCLSLAKPKYDPCRRFKEGDKVRIVQYKGRDYCDEVKIYRGKITEVLSDEDDYYVEINIRIGGITLGIDPAYLELVTPVEESMPRFSSEDYDRKEQDND